MAAWVGPAALRERHGSTVDGMSSAEFEKSFDTACREQGLDPANTNMFTLECVRQGLDPKKTRAFDLDKNPTPLWASFRKLKTAS